MRSCLSARIEANFLISLTFSPFNHLNASSTSASTTCATLVPMENLIESQGNIKPTSHSNEFSKDFGSFFEDRDFTVQSELLEDDRKEFVDKFNCFCFLNNGAEMIYSN